MARLDERLAQARRAVARLIALPADAAAVGDAPTANAIAGDARLLRFLVAFDAVWLAARQLMLDRYGPIQGTADGTIRACGDVGLLSADAVAQLRETAAFQANALERFRCDGTIGDLTVHTAAVAAWLEAVDGERPDAAAGPSPAG